MNSKAADLAHRFPVLMNLGKLRHFFAGALHHRQTGPALAGSALAERLTACERIADRVAALGDTWGPIIGPEPFLAAWSLLHGLARTARARASRPVSLQRGQGDRIF